MPRIPIQSLTSVRQSGSAVTAGAFQQTANAASNLLGSLSGAAQVIHRELAEAQDLRNRSEVSEKKRQIREGQAIFQNELLRDNVDPSEWGPRWQKRLLQLESGLGLRDSAVAPVVKRAVGEAFKTFAGQSFIQISGAALKENRKRARQNFDRDLQDFFINRDYVGAEQLVRDSTGTVLDEGEGSDMVRTTQRLAQRDEREFALNADPVGYAQGIRDGKYGKMSPLQQQKELEKAERKRGQLESQGLADIRELEQGGFIESTDDLKRELDSNPYISDTTKAAYLKNYETNQPLPPEEQFALQDAIDANVLGFQNGTLSAEEYEQEWTRLQAQVHAYGSRKGVGRFNADLHNVRPSLFSGGNAGGDEEAARQRLRELKPLQTTGNALVKERADGLASIAYLEQRKGDSWETLDRDELVSNAQLKKDIEEHSVLVRSALQAEMQDFILGFDGTPTEGDLIKFLNENQDRISRRVLDDKATRDSGLLLPLEPTAAERANKWLGTPDPAQGGSLLPPIDGAKNGSPGDFIFKEEGGVGTTGKGDKYGQVSEIYGMNRKADGANYTKVKKIYDTEGEAAAKQEAWSILSGNAARDGFKSTNNPKVQEILVGIHHHRGVGGATTILQTLTGTQLTGPALVAKFEEVVKVPGFADEWFHAREKQENEKYGARPQFRKGLSSRWRKEAAFLSS